MQNTHFYDCSVAEPKPDIFTKHYATFESVSFSTFMDVVTINIISMLTELVYVPWVEALAIYVRFGMQLRGRE